MTLNPGYLAVFVGILLLLFELFFFTAYIFPLGVAFIVSGILYLFYPSFWLSLAVFFAVSGLLYWVSYRYIKRIKGTREVLAELRSQEGVVIGRVDRFTYKIRFPLGAAGEEVWNAYSETELHYGDRVRVVDIKGNKLVVEKVADA